MTRYQAMFDRLGETGEAALGAFLMLGDPDLSTSAALLDCLVAGGADMIEVGIPFSDPVADGPVIQAAANRALAAGVRVADCIGLVRNFRGRHPDVPIGILTYANIAVARGFGHFCRDLANGGVDSLLVADIPSLEAEPFAREAREAGLDWVMIAATNSGDEAIGRIARMSSGYSYCVTRFGVTGEQSRLELDHDGLVGRLDDAGAPPPVFGFGIASPAHVEQALDAGARGVIVGSALVGLVEGPDQEHRIAEKVAELKAATRRSS